MQLSETLGDLRPRAIGPAPAAPLFGVWSVALHAAVIAWFLAGGGGGGTEPVPLPGLAPGEQPLYVTIIPDPTVPPLPTAAPAVPEIPAEPMEPVATAPVTETIQPEEIPGLEIPESPVEADPTPEVEAVETVEAVEVAEAPTPRLTSVQPPARPERHAPRQTEQAASQATSSLPTAPTPVPTSAQTPQPAALPGGKAGPIGPAETGLFEKAATFPDYLANPAPAYPRSELRRGREGLVLLRVRVTPKGRPSEISVSRSSGIAAFDQAAVRAVRAWRFLPATRGGQPIAGTVKVPIRFALNRS